jgi:hypothetical protein
MFPTKAYCWPGSPKRTKALGCRPPESMCPTRSRLLPSGEMEKWAIVSVPVMGPVRLRFEVYRCAALPEEGSSAIASSAAPQVDALTVEGSTEGGKTLRLEMAVWEKGGVVAEGLGETAKMSSVLESSLRT